MTIVKSFSVGDGDMFYIRHNSSNFTIIDCCLDDDTSDDIIAELLEQQAGKEVVRFISTHPDDDHIRGLEDLDDELNLINFYCVKNSATKPNQSDDFDRYCELRDSNKAFYIYAGCVRKWMNLGDSERKTSGLSIWWPKTENEHYKKELKNAEDGKSPNNISPIISYMMNDGVAILWMGDLETEFMEKIKNDVNLQEIHILFAPHHGRDSGKVPQSWLNVLKPKIIVIGEAPSEHLNYYESYNTITQNSAGDITFDCNGSDVDIYVSNPNYSVDFLIDNEKDSKHNGYYLGTLEV